ncbi:MAG: hypothetical protein Q9161_008601 [Pseudevernia consocians]
MTPNITQLLKVVEDSIDIRTTIRKFIYRLPTDKDKFKYAVKVVDLGADLHDKMAAVIVEAWETIFTDGLWHIKFKFKDMAKKSLNSKAYLRFGVYIE